MPIVFAQPEPFSQSTSQGAGQAEQFSRDLPVLARQQESIADLYARAAQARASAGGGGQGALQAQLQNSAMQGQSQMAAEQRAGDTQGLQARLGSQEGMQAQQLQAQQRLASTQLSQAENIRLQRMRTALGTIREQVDSGHLTQEQGNNLAIQVQTGIDPLEQRRQQSQIDAAHIQQRAMEQRVAQLDRLEKERTQFRTRGLDQRRGSIIDNNGDEHDFILGIDGTIDHHATALLQGGGPGRAGGGRQTGGGQQGGQVQAPDQRQTAAAWHQVSQEMAQEDRPPAGGWTDARPRPAWAGSEDARQAEAIRRVGLRTVQPDADQQGREADAAQRQRVTREVNLQYRDLPREERQAMVEGRIGLEGQAGPARREFRQEEDRVRGQLAEQVARVRNPLTGQPLPEGTRARIVNDAVRGHMQRWTPPSSPQGQDQEQQAQEQRSPIPATTNQHGEVSFDARQRESMTPRQRAAVDGLQTVWSAVSDNPDLSADRRQVLGRNFHAAQRLLVQAGSRQGMTRQEGERYDELLRSLDVRPRTAQERSQAEAQRRRQTRSPNLLEDIPDWLTTEVPQAVTNPFGSRPARRIRSE